MAARNRVQRVKKVPAKLKDNVLPLVTETGDGECTWLNYPLVLQVFTLHGSVYHMLLCTQPVRNVYILHVHVHDT